VAVIPITAYVSVEEAVGARQRGVYLTFAGPSSEHRWTKMQQLEIGGEPKA
jgi:hypothetical protein